MPTSILTPKQQEILGVLGKTSLLRQFYLAGGTALALHLGHRRSVDFDFFRRSRFNATATLAKLEKHGVTRVLLHDINTLTVRFEGVKLSFFHHPPPLISKRKRTAGGLIAAGVADIAAMKIAAICGRGSRKDFIDLYAICTTRYSLREVVRFFQQKYRASGYDLYHVQRSLVYFDDAEKDVMPRMLVVVNWEDVKEFFREQTASTFNWSPL